ncbi:SIR2 family protein [Vibrio splendidus]|uniref:SIR2 family protein n=1 Tax=Vibrio splendidus TaxID=29497 RepID=UPI000C83BAF5|nr:SIR2 family protein [Vibrio splendidus]PMI50054.1 hypothetical protein BCU42_12205 [Vibrio splendidus]
MNIREFVGQYHNHPVLFVGAGLSLRYLLNSYTWDGLLSMISLELTDDPEIYLSIKSKCQIEGKYDYTKVAQKLEVVFNEKLEDDRNGKFKEVNDKFFESMQKGVNYSRFKIFISEVTELLDYREEMETELSELKKIRKNIGSVVTTNYDSLIEDVFGFEPLVGNNILLSNPYGSVYKIHGCHSQPDKIIVTENDYEQFNKKYELIRAQLLSIFIHNPIIFIGYNIGDDNIKSLLKTIFTYVEPNSETAERIKNNFLLVEYDKGSESHEIKEHDIDLEGFSTISINKIKTDDYVEIYSALSDLNLPISAMDVRKVQNVVKDIYEGGSIKVSITEDIDTLKNGDKILAIGSRKTISYTYQDAKGMINEYFNLIDEANSQRLLLINQFTIASPQWFPIYGFAKICNEIEKADVLKKQQQTKLATWLETAPRTTNSEHQTIQEIFDDEEIASGTKIKAMVWSVLNDRLDLDDVNLYLKSLPAGDITSTDNRRLLCAYDYKKYSNNAR